MSTMHRRSFLRAAAAASAGLALRPLVSFATQTSSARVAIARCTSYGPEVRAAFDRCFDLLGGIGALVKDKTVTIKVNLTGSDFKALFGRPVGESYITHPETARALAAALFAAGARRVRFVESTQLREPLEGTLIRAGWDWKAFESLGRVEAENTRNLGFGKDYATFKVPGSGYLFESFDLNHSYADTDVFVSLCKLKTHATTGITLTMKNLFGITPNALYGDDAPNEEGTRGRLALHAGAPPAAERAGGLPFDPPGAKEALAEKRDDGYRIPRILVDVNAARPIHLGIIDGITTMNRGEGPWIGGPPQSVIEPGVLICGLNAVATDAVGTAVMGFDDLRAPRGRTPFGPGDNHLVLAEQAGLGPADLTKIEVLGEPIGKVRGARFVPCTRG